MGTPISPPIDLDKSPAGLLCSVCWGSAGAFGESPTPQMISINMENFEKGVNWVAAAGEPPSGQWYLWQSGFSPCQFTFLAGNNNYNINFQATRTVFQIIRNGIFYSINFIVTTKCPLFFEYTDDDYFKSGTVEITLLEIE